MISPSHFCFNEHLEEVSTPAVAPAFDLITISGLIIHQPFKNTQSPDEVKKISQLEELTLFSYYSHSPVVSSWHGGSTAELLFVTFFSFFRVFRHFSSLFMHRVTSSRVMPTAEAALRYGHG